MNCRFKTYGVKFKYWLYNWTGCTVIDVVNVGAGNWVAGIESGMIGRYLSLPLVITSLFQCRSVQGSAPNSHYLVHDSFVHS